MNSRAFLRERLAESGAAAQLAELDAVDTVAPSAADASAVSADTSAAAAARRIRSERRHAQRAAVCAQLELPLTELQAAPGAQWSEDAREVLAQVPLVEHLAHGPLGLSRFEAHMAERCHAAIADGTGAMVGAELDRISSRAPHTAFRAWFAALGIGADGLATRQFAGHGSGARRARGIALTAVILAEADRLAQRPSQCMIARIISPPDCAYPICRDCGHEHMSKRTLSHWDPHERDALDGDIGYLQALWLTGTIESWQWRHPDAIERYCYPHEIGRRGWPVAHYTMIADVADEPDPDAAPLSPIAAMERRWAAESVRWVLSCSVRLRPRTRLRVARVDQERLAELRRANEPQ